MTMFTDEAGLDAWLSSYSNREKTLDYADWKLDPIRAVMDRLSPPQRPLTIAGSKGKGSTLVLVEAMLLSMGEHTLATVSPHVTSVCERWRIDGRSAPIPILNQAAALVSQAEDKEKVQLTYFEKGIAMIGALALLHPEKRLLLEVGLGGELDATNTLDAAVAVVTRLDLEHTAILGPTLHHIAQAKTGIARADAPLVIAPQSTPATLALNRLHTPCRQLHHVQTGWAPSQLERHQQENLATAITALRAWGLKPTTADIDSAARNGRLPGRCQVLIHKGRRIMVDGAHTPESIAATLASAAQQFPKGYTLILGLGKDKDIDSISEHIPGDISVIRCAYAGERAREESDHWPAHLAEAAWHDRIESALAGANSRLPVVVTGSLYLAGECLAALA